MTESSTAANAAASAKSPISGHLGEIRISLSEYAECENRTAWQMAREKIAAEIADSVFGAGGTIELGDCGRPWCTESAGEHPRHHVGDDVSLVKDHEDLGTWLAYLLQEPGEADFESVKIAFGSYSDDLDFELPVWQLTVLRDLFADEFARRQLGDLIRLAAGEVAPS